MLQAVLRVIEREDNSDRKRALEAALSQIDRAFGKGSVMKLGQREKAVDADAVSTGSLGLDIALGIGGLPRGRVIEIYGPESSGKTTLALHAVAEIQKKGGIAAYVDAEHALDPGYAKKLGVDIDELLISQPDTGEQALEIAAPGRPYDPGRGISRSLSRHRPSIAHEHERDRALSPREQRTIGRVGIRLRATTSRPPAPADDKDASTRIFARRHDVCPPEVPAEWRPE